MNLHDEGVRCVVPLLMPAGRPQCGSAGAYVLDVYLCAAYRMGRAWGLG